MSSDLSTRRKGFDPSLWISQTEAAKLRGVSRQAIAGLVKKGRFRTLEVGGKKLLLLSDVEAYEPRKPGPEARKKPTK
jgi:excisionase family DNA binding protein